jgi:hypothetical protein
LRKIVASGAPVNRSKTTRLQLRGIPVAVACVVVSALAFNATPASATLTGEVVKVAGSIVPEVTAPAPPAAPAPPSPPSATPPSTPSVAAPAAPQVPAKLPTGAATSSPSSNPAPTVASSATKASSPVADGLADAGATETSKQAAPAVSRTSKQAATAVSSTSHEKAKQVAAPNDPPSIRPARAAPLRRWFAYVWPANALGGDGAALARSAGALPLTVAGVARLLFIDAIRAIRASTSGAPTLSGNVATPDAPPSAAPDRTFVPSGPEISFFVIFSFAALLALLAFTVWVEIRSKYLYR